MLTKHPDITPAQVVGAIGSVAGLAVTDTLIGGHTAKLITGLASIVVPLVFVAADALIRHGRAKVAAAQVQHGGTPTPPPA